MEVTGQLAGVGFLLPIMASRDWTQIMRFDSKWPSHWRCPAKYRLGRKKGEKSRKVGGSGKGRSGSLPSTATGLHGS